MKHSTHKKPGREILWGAFYTDIGEGRGGARHRQCNTVAPFGGRGAERAIWGCFIREPNNGKCDRGCPVRVPESRECDMVPFGARRADSAIGVFHAEVGEPTLR